MTTQTTPAPKFSLTISDENINAGAPTTFTGDTMKEVNKKIRIARRDAKRAQTTGTRRVENARFECYGYIGRLYCNPSMTPEVVVEGGGEGFELAYKENGLADLGFKIDAMALMLEDDHVYAIRVQTQDAFFPTGPNGTEWQAISSQKKDSPRERVTIPAEVAKRLEVAAKAASDKRDEAELAEIERRDAKKKGQQTPAAPAGNKPASKK